LLITDGYRQLPKITEASCFNGSLRCC